MCAFLRTSYANLIFLILKCLKGVDDANAARCTPLISHGNPLFFRLYARAKDQGRGRSVARLSAQESSQVF